MLRRLLAATVMAALAHTAYSQGCTAGSGQIFLKNDNLPDIPGTATVSIIQGLCEGEAMGCVFDVSNQTTFSSEVKVNMVAGAYINPASASGIAAVVNLQIYDGISWVGTTPVLGPLVFDFENDAGASIQFSSSGINTVDISNFNVTVTSGKLVVAWFMQIQGSTGSCAAGYNTNFATDNVMAACSAPCAPVQKNLIFIQGQGWRDPMTATVSGFPLCSCFYAGNWIIRACVSPEGYPRSYCTGKLNSANCVASVGWTGTATLSGADDFHVTCSNVVFNKQGIMFWGSNTAALPFFNGFLCVAQPVIRTPVQNSGGSSGCNGSFDFHFTHAYMNQYGLMNGDLRHAEFWYRDPQNLDGTNIGLSNALTFEITN
jgi:hypothetical protein